MTRLREVRRIIEVLEKEYLGGNWEGQIWGKKLDLRVQGEKNRGNMRGRWGIVGKICVALIIYDFVDKKNKVN